MPPITKGKKGKSAKNKKQESTGIDPVKVLKQLLLEYESKCSELHSGICPSIKLALRESIEQEKLLTKFIVCPRDRKELTIWADEDLLQLFDPNYEPPPIERKKRSKSRSRSRSSSSRRSAKKGEPASGQVLINRFLKPDPPSDKPLAKVQPLLEALRCKRYTHITALYIWDMVLNLIEMTSISNFIQKGFYPLTKVELLDCLIQSYTLNSFGLSTCHCKTLTEIILDNNEFGDKGCNELCEGLIGNKYLNSLSLCYCGLTYASGKILGRLVSETSILDLYLDGNELEAEGCVHLIEELAEYSQIEAKEREEIEKRILQEKAEKAMKGDSDYHYQSRSSLQQQQSSENAASESAVGKKGSAKGKKKKKKGKKRGKKKKEPEGPVIAPVLRKLHLADNGIDQMGRGANFGCLKCVIFVCTLIENSRTLAEINLWGNDIGDVGGRLLLESLQTRKEAKHPGIAMKVCARMNSETFMGIRKLASGVKTKKKRGRRRKKK